MVAKLSDALAAYANAAARAKAAGAPARDQGAAAEPSFSQLLSQATSNAIDNNRAGATPRSRCKQWLPCATRWSRPTRTSCERRCDRPAGPAVTMSEADVIDIARESIIVMIKLGGPIMLVSLGVGLIISLVQALTQVQEATLSFVPKIIVVFLSLMLWLPFMLSTLTTFTHSLADRIIGMGSAGG
jgi:flagellar biosynthetic protein FliQ